MASVNRWDRRSVVKAAGLGAMAAFTQPVAWVRGEETSKPNGNLKQSVCQWCYKDTPIEKLAEEAKRIGYQSVELLTPDKFKLHSAVWPHVCAMLSGACTIPDGFNEKKRHDQLEKSTREHIDFAAENGSAQRDRLLGQSPQAHR